MALPSPAFINELKGEIKRLEGEIERIDIQALALQEQRKLVRDEIKSLRKMLKAKQHFEPGMTLFERIVVALKIAGNEPQTTKQIGEAVGVHGQVLSCRLRDGRAKGILIKHGIDHPFKWSLANWEGSNDDSLHRGTTGGECQAQGGIGQCGRDSGSP